MSRPPFYAGTAPSAWLRTPRTSESPARYAYAGTRFTPERGMGTAIFWFVALPLLIMLFASYFAR